MTTRVPIEINEWYHCYNRGVDKRRIFLGKVDYERFLAIMFLSNGTKNVRLSDRYDTSLKSVLADAHIDRGEPLVEIGAYSLMPNHVHFILKETRESGIPHFMHKVSTAYSMYFNKKNSRTGSLFSGAFKSKHIHDDRYFKHVVAYVLLNAAELFEPRWKKGVANHEYLEKRLLQYAYASLPDFCGVSRPENSIISKKIHDMYDELPSTKEMIADAQAYYREQKDLF